MRSEGIYGEKILKSMPAEELRVLKERAAFSYLNRELSEVLWEGSGERAGRTAVRARGDGLCPRQGVLACTACASHSG